MAASARALAHTTERRLIAFHRTAQCECGHCHACTVREIRHRDLGGVPHCALCEERRLQQIEYQRLVDRTEYSVFPFPAPTMWNHWRDYVVGRGSTGRRIGRKPAA